MRKHSVSINLGFLYFITTLGISFGNSVIHFLCVWLQFIIIVYVFSVIIELDKKIDEKEKVMGNRLIEGMKALTELCHNAFDHIKTNSQKIDKINAKLGDHTTRIHRLDQRSNQLVGSGNKKTKRQEIRENFGRAGRPQQSDQTRSGRIDREPKIPRQDVPNIEHKP